MDVTARVETWKRLAREEDAYNDELVRAYGHPLDNPVPEYKMSLLRAKNKAATSAWNRIPQWKRDEILDGPL